MSGKRILFIHEEKKVKYGAHYINDLIVEKLKKRGYLVHTIYPKESISIFSKSLDGIKNILFFYSLINMRKRIRRYDIIQGTTYTTLPFLDIGKHVISHFGSTTYGFLKSVPSKNKLEIEKKELSGIFMDVKKELSISPRSRPIRSLEDISKLEIEVAKKSSAVIATSKHVQNELIRNKVDKNKVHLIHNAIEDYWFESMPIRKVKDRASLVYLGRMGDDLFTIRLKGLLRLIYVLRMFPEIQKTVIGMCSNTKGYSKLFSRIPNLTIYLSVEKKRIPSIIRHNYGDIYINAARYEGFCLSLIEAMSRGLIPVIYPVGVAPEIIENGRNGYLVHNLDEMIEKIKFLMLNKSLRRNMAVEAIKTSKLFKPDILINRLLELYSQLANRSSSL